MNILKKIEFYGNLVPILSLFCLEGREINKKERAKEISQILENVRNKEKDETYSNLERMAHEFDQEFFDKWVDIGEEKIIFPQFERILLEGQENLVQKENEVIAFVSSHRSLYDIPLVGMVTRNYGINPPIYTAGSNLAKRPLKHALKKLGAALLDREKLRKGDRQEIALAIDYFSYLNEQGINTVNFAEATRSRTTAFDEINSMFFQPVINGQEKRGDLDYKIICVTESYDFTPEDSELVKNKEASGRKKSIIENIEGILNIHKWIGNNFGNAYLNFSEPIYIKKVNKRNEIQKIVEEKLKKQYKITNYMLAAYALSKNEDLDKAADIYLSTGQELKFDGFNVDIKSKNSFYWTLTSPLAKRIIQNEDLKNYYSAFIYQIKNEKRLYNTK